MALQEVLASFGFDIDLDKLKEADTKVTGLTGRLQVAAKVLGSVVAAGAVGAGIARISAWVGETAGAVDMTAKFATALGTTTRAVAQWDYVLQNAGANQEQARAGLRTYAKQVGEARKGNEDLQTTLRKLGVEFRDSKGQLVPLEKQLDQAVTGLGKMTDAAKRAAIAEQIFGEGGLAFVRVGQDGAEALEAQRNEFNALHPNYEEYVRDAQAAAVAQDGWRNATQAFRDVVVGALLPAFTAILRAVNSTVKWFSRMLAGTKVIQIVLIALGAAATVAGALLIKAFAAPIAIFLAVASAILIVVLLIEDLYQLFTGGESVIGQALDDLLGMGKARIVVESIMEAFFDLFDAVLWVGKSTVQAYEWIVNGAKLVIQKVSGLWATLKNITVNEFLGGIKAAAQAVLDFISEQIDKVLGKIAGIIDKAKRAGQAVSEFFGGSDEGRSQVARGLEGTSFGAALPTAASATSRAVPTRGAATVQSTSTNNINVTSAATDPAAVAREVAAELDKVEERRMRQMREELVGS